MEIERIMMSMADANKGNGAGKHSPIASPNPGRLLVVDDFRYDLEFLSRGMIQRGHEVVMAESGEEALDRIADTEFDLVLLDGRLPTFDGIELLNLIRKRKGPLQLPIIMTTGWDQAEMVVRALDAGANDYVTKPLDLNIVSARVNTQLALLNLLRQQEEFLAFASHDLRTPLSVIMGYTSIFKLKQEQGILDIDELATVFTALHRTASFMNEIVNDFVDFHALQGGNVRLRRERVDVAELLTLTQESTNELARRKGIALEVHPPAQPVRIHCDETRVAQILQNLVGNAIKFCTDGCTVEVKAAEEEHVVRFEVIDDGPGIQHDQRHDLFKKFARLAAEPTGGEKSSGLGLSICKQLVELHGGKIGAEENDKFGATFWFTIPKGDTAGGLESVGG